MAGLASLGRVDLGALDEREQYAGQHLGIGTPCQGALLRATELGRRDHLHGLGDLPRVLHAADTAPDVEDVSHVLVHSTQYAVPSYASEAKGPFNSIRDSPA